MTSLSPIPMPSILALLLMLLLGFVQADSLLSCSVNNEDRDPALKEMAFDVGDGTEKFWAYVQPNVTSFYQDVPAPSSTAVSPKHTGLAGMFINLSNKPVRLYWESRVEGPRSLIEIQDPFSSGGTATFPTHSFIFTPNSDEDKQVLARFTVGEYPDNVHVYDPYHVEGDKKQTQENLKALTEEEMEKYKILRKSYLFGLAYRNFTGRSYLVNYPRPPPIHFMWRADYFNQTHWVTTRETHFAKLPPSSLLTRITQYGKARALKTDDPRLLQEFRSSESILNMTLRVLSCAPRVFEIDNFLSSTEVEHLMAVAYGEDLSRSQTGQGESAQSGDQVRKTRTSYNAWVERERSPIIDAVYRRAADLLRIDEALLRHRGDGEYPDLGSDKTIAESLQLVHYDPMQEYTAHHDFGYSSVDEPFQAQRFSTILLYLNEGMRGGETSFPRWQNAESFEELKVKPEVGKAVLFYSQLPDGNMDDFSQHEAKKVFEGEKWLTNLWVWNPVYEK